MVVGRPLTARRVMAMAMGTAATKVRLAMLRLYDLTRRIFGCKARNPAWREEPL